MSNLNAALQAAVFVGAAIPSHDETHDLAAEIAERLDALHAYVASVRSPEQADAALLEFSLAIGAAVAAQAGAVPA